MWTIEPRDVIHLRGGGGELFTIFVDDVIRCLAFLSGCASSNILTNQRTNVADGGVDTEIRAKFDGDDTGWFCTPTCWQYKATDYKNIKETALREEMHKPYARRLIASGFGYRLCICDEMPAQKKSEFEDILKAEANGISSSCTACHVLTAADIASLATRYPALILKHFSRNIPNALHFSAWAKSVRELTRVYVPVPDWQPN